MSSSNNTQDTGAQNTENTSSSQDDQQPTSIQVTTYISPYGPQPDAPHGLPSLYNTQFPPLPDHLPLRDDSVPAIIQRLLDPEPELYSADGKKVTLGLWWAIGKVGFEHFEHDGEERRVLREDSTLRAQGREEGLPDEILNWLNGDPATETLEIEAEKLKVVER